MGEEKEKRELEILTFRDEKDIDIKIGLGRSTERCRKGRIKKRRGEPGLKDIVFFLFSSSCLGLASESSSLKRDEK